MMVIHSLLTSLKPFRFFRVGAACFSAAALMLYLHGADEPPLPPGLGEPPDVVKRDSTPPNEGLGDPGEEASGAPTLPEGLGALSEDHSKSDAGDGSSELPDGLGGGDSRGDQDAFDNTKGETAKPSLLDHLPFYPSGFAELRYGRRLQQDPNQDQATVPEARWQLSLDGRSNGLGYRLTGDFLYNAQFPSHAIDLRRGTGWVDLREARVDARPASFLDVKAGRMIATWGTGDLLFLNDLFPKDWRSFLLGRDVEYLKAPTRGVRAQGYFDWVNLDVLVNPQFAPDRFIDGRQVSFYDPASGGLIGRNRALDADIPKGAELHARAHRTFGSTEVALYFYDGYWKSPGGRDRQGRAVFPDLRAWGGSIRGNALGGIAHAEFSFYDSREDRDGTDPLINNRQMRYLIGYERELMPDFTGGVQAYVEQKLDFGDYRENLPPGFPEDDEYRTVLTLRLTRLLLLQTLELSSFIFYSPTDEDWYWRPSASYKIDDRWTFSAGAGLFGGKNRNTFYSQFRDNSNAWVALRFGY